MAKILKPIVRSGGFYPSRKYTPLVYPGGYTTLNAKNGKPDPLNTISGSIVRFISNHVKPFVKTVVNIDPVQDLHGYDNPWPAGGGANKFDKDNANIINGYVGSSKINSDSQFRTVYIPCKPNTTYTASKLWQSKDRLAIAYTETLPEVNVPVYGVVSKTSGTASTRASVTTTTGANAQYIVVWVGYASTIDYGTVMIEESSTASAAFAPYSNECPISGWTGCEVVDAGKNLLDYDAFTPNAYLDANGDVVTVVPTPGGNAWNISDYIPVDGTFTISGIGTVGTAPYSAWYNKSKRFLSSFKQGNATFTPPANAAFCRLSIYSPPDNEVQLERGTSATAYTAFQGQTLPITFPDSAGTVYGGELTVNEDGTGVLTVTHVMDDMGDLEWVYNPEYDYPYFTSKALDYRYRANGALSVIAEMFKGIPNVNAQTMRNNSGYNGCICYNSGLSTSYKLIVQDLAITSENDFTDAVRGTKVVSLINPSYQPTYNLTADQLMTLKGENNIWADTGELTITAYGTPIIEPQADTLTSLNILLGGAYHNAGTADDVPDDEALNILMGGSTT